MVPAVAIVLSHEVLNLESVSLGHIICFVFMTIRVRRMADKDVEVIATKYSCSVEKKYF